MYFNSLPQNFGLSQQDQQSDQAQNLVNQPLMGYNQGIGGLPPRQDQNPMQQPNPAPQLGNISNSVASTAGLANRQLPQLQPTQKPMAGQAMAGGGVVHQNLQKSKVVSDGIAALRGQHPNPRAALHAYDQHFGSDATSELIRSFADGGVVSGPGSGVADLVPGSIDGREDVRIASGEYVVPAWAVATLGDGSTEAGAKILDAMVARLREAGSELIKGTDPINPSEFLPA
jgi:hypothetical protein